LRERLLERAAATVFADGVSALSLRSLASDTGTSTAAVYSLFGGKPGLIRALYARAFGAFGSRLDAVGATDDPVEDVVRLGLAYRAAALADPHGYRVMFGGEVRPADVGRKAARDGAKTFGPLLDAVRRGVAAGRFPSGPAPESIATALWANVHGLVSLELGEFVPPQAGPPAEIFEAAVRATADGWTIRPRDGSSAYAVGADREPSKETS
jgi:AcrR family transcriptional regulator